uniref:inorganic diphosphatase n=1 Tax=Cacopsylla melanoneura TaxID=428564 RepID=A0A8D8TCS5_9HEMI
MGSLLMLLLLTSSVYTMDEGLERWKRQRVEAMKEQEPLLLNIRPVARGIPKTSDYRIFYKSEHGIISPLHDIPLYAVKRDRLFNMIVEMPKWTQTQMQMSLGESMNPIRPGNPMANPYYTIWNYGTLAQTFEHPNTTDPNTGYKRDGQPLDVIEIGDDIPQRGDILRVKALGAIGILDKGRIDYKIIAINADDPKYGRMHDIDDVETFLPGHLNDTIDWFKNHRSKDVHIFKINLTHDFRQNEGAVLTDVDIIEKMFDFDQEYEKSTEATQGDGNNTDTVNRESNATHVIHGEANATHALNEAGNHTNATIEAPRIIKHKVIMNRKYAHKMITRSFNQWHKMMLGQLQAPAGLSIVNTCVKGSASKIPFDQATAELRNRSFPAPNRRQALKSKQKNRTKATTVRVRTAEGSTIPTESH